MDQATFLREAKFIARRNINDAVTAVFVRFDENRGHLLVVYCFDHAINDDDREWSELTCGELIAAFPEIKTADIQCCAPDDCAREGEKGTIVFSRKGI